MRLLGWLFLAVAILLPAAGQGAAGSVVFSEIMYQPAVADEASMEWVELENLMTVDVDLSGWSLADGVQFKFPPGTVIRGGAHLILSGSPAALMSATGLTNVLGPLSGRLSNSGETLELRNNANRLIDSVSYGDNLPWPVGPDGGGPSLAKKDPRLASDSAESWTASAQVGGTPGARNFRPGDPTLTTLVGGNTPAKVLIPTTGVLGQSWTAVEFDDAAWSNATASVAFDRSLDETYFDEVMADRPAGYWRLDETSGTSALDASGNNRHGTYQGGVTLNSPGVLPGGDRAVAFNGTSGYVQLPGAWGNVPEVTVEAWVYTTDPVTGDFQSVIATPDGGFTHFQLHTAGNAGAYVPGGFVALPIPSPIPTAVWRHIVMVLKSGDSLIYVNGVPLGPGITDQFVNVSPAAFSPGGTRGVRIANGHLGGRWFRGRIDEAAIYYTALSADRVRTHYFAGASVSLTNHAGTDVAAWMTNRSSAYLRIPFALEEAELVDALRLRVKYDDGFVAYLNGTPVASRNVPANPAFDAVALESHADGVSLQAEEISLTPFAHLLVNGPNVLALHGLNAGATNDDFLLVPELVVHKRDPSFTLALNEVSASGDAVFRVEIVNTGRADLDLGGYVLAKGLTGPEAFVLPSQILGAGAVLTVSQAQMGFRLADGEKLYLYAPDRRGVVDALVVRATAQARATDGSGPWLFTSLPSFGATNFVARQDEIVINEIHYHHQPVPDRPAVVDDSIAVAIGATWRVNQQGVDLGTDWRLPGYDDTGWGGGPALLYVSTAALPAPKLTPLTLGRRTYYFRTQFLFEGSTQGVSLSLRPLLDDGAVFYLNGVEVLRRNMPTGNVSYVTFASSTVVTASFTGPFPISTASLLSGVNTLAVEVHQATSGDTDVVLGAELKVRRELTPAVPFSESPGEWVELYNRSTNTVNLNGWRFDGGIDFRFAGDASIAPGAFLVVASDPAGLRTQFPGIAVLGPFTNRLANGGERLVLKDPNNNAADEVPYLDGGRWPGSADGAGPSLELRDSRSDNSKGEAWAASDEGSRSAWRTYTYRGVAAASFGPDTQWREFVLGLLEEGEVLLDDISVLEDPDGARVQMLPNTTFTSGLGRWRMVGNHHGTVAADPDNAGNLVLRLVARGPTEHWSNHAETTLANGRSVINGRVYEISFRAKWIAGCRKLHTRLYFNRLAQVTLIDAPARNGTPGAQNSAFVSNLGPTYDGLRHSPSVPLGAESVAVSVLAGDPDGVAGLTLWHRVNDGTWNDTPMIRDPLRAGHYEASIPGQTPGSVVQFYVVGADGLGATSLFPAAGPNSRALYKVNDGQANFALGHNLRVVMLPVDANSMMANSNLMSNDQLGCTVVYDEDEVFYDCGVRLRGTAYSRPFPQLVSFSLYFPPEHLFRGGLSSIDVDRSGRGPVGSPGQDEMLIKFLLNRAGLPCEQDDIVRFIAPLPAHTSSAMLMLGHYSAEFLDSAFPGGNDSMVFEYDGAYYPTRTGDGNPESPKAVEPGPISYTDIRNLGDEKEGYRWNFIPHNNRERDDYTQIIAMAKAFDLTGPALDAATRPLLDVDNWLRTFAVLSLTGVHDAYTIASPHNLWLYVHPIDGRVLSLAHDWDVSFGREVNAPLTGNTGNFVKVINLPANLRVYYWHLRDLVTNTWNAAYMRPWADHYDNFLPGQDFSGIVNYIGQRANYVLSQLPRAMPFAITNNQGADFLTDTTNVTLRGQAGIDVRSLSLNGGANALVVTWLTPTNWQVTSPLLLGPNLFTFSAIDYAGSIAATDHITVTTSAPGGGTDTDGDRLPDAWEQANGFSVNAPNAGEDPDGDGVNNYAEYLAGTHPRQAQSFPRLMAARGLDATLNLSFSAVAGRSYSLLHRQELGTGVWVKLSDIAPSVADRVYQTNLFGPPEVLQGFYQLTVPKLP